MSNRYVIRGICEDLREGKSVALLTFHRQEGRIIFDSVIRELDEREVDNFNLTNGSERLRHVSTRGVLRVITQPAAVTQDRPDVLLVIGWDLLPEAVKSHVMYVASRGTEMIRL